MAEDTVKRVTGMNPRLLAKPYSIPFDRTLMGSSQPNLNQTDMIPNQISEDDSFASNSVVTLEASCNAFEATSWICDKVVVVTTVFGYSLLCSRLFDAHWFCNLTTYRMHLEEMWWSLKVCP